MSSVVISCDGMDYIPRMFLDIEKCQCDRLSTLTFGDKVEFVYNPLEYAKETHEDYVKKYCRGPKPVLFLGMNPGPFGMAQNGVPFGDVSYVKNWLGIEGNVKKPLKEHPKKVIEGLNCRRSEVSGGRLWSLFEDIAKTPGSFFKHSFVHNFCPLAFLSKTGKNVTPPELPLVSRKAMIDICSESLADVLKLLNVQFVVGIGRFAEQMANDIIRKEGISNVQVFGIMHPSPINPAANKGWKEAAFQQLTDIGIIHYLRS